MIKSASTFKEQFFFRQVQSKTFGICKKVSALCEWFLLIHLNTKHPVLIGLSTGRNPFDARPMALRFEPKKESSQTDPEFQTV